MARSSTRPALLEACERAARPRRRLHLISLIGPGGVHANDRHLVALAELAARQGVPAVRDPRPARRPRHAAVVGAGVRHGPRAPARRCPPGRRDRDGRGPLLRHGPRSALGARRSAATTRSSMAWRPACAGRRQRRSKRPTHAARTTSSSRPPSSTASTAPLSRRPDHARQLPRRPGTAADPRPRRRRLRRLRPDRRRTAAPPRPACWS